MTRTAREQDFVWPKTATPKPPSLNRACSGAFSGAGEPPNRKLNRRSLCSPAAELRRGRRPDCVRGARAERLVVAAAPGPCALVRFDRLGPRRHLHQAQARRRHARRSGGCADPGRSRRRDGLAHFRHRRQRPLRQDDRGRGRQGDPRRRDRARPRALRPAARDRRRRKARRDPRRRRQRLGQDDDHRQARGAIVGRRPPRRPRRRRHLPRRRDRAIAHLGRTARLRGDRRARKARTLRRWPSTPCARRGRAAPTCC